MRFGGTEVFVRSHQTDGVGCGHGGKGDGAGKPMGKWGRGVGNGGGGMEIGGGHGVGGEGRRDCETILLILRPSVTEPVSHNRLTEKQRRSTV